MKSSCGSPGREVGPGAPLFACHLSREGSDIVCSGWLTTCGIDHLGIRIAVLQERLPPEALQATSDFPPLHPSFEAMKEAQTLRSEKPLPSPQNLAPALSTEYYVLSLYRTQKDPLLSFFRSGAQGYAYPLEWAGVYSGTEVEDQADYLDNKRYTIAVPKPDVEALAVPGPPSVGDWKEGEVRIVRNTRSTLQTLRTAARRARARRKAAPHPPPIPEPACPSPHSPPSPPADTPSPSSSGSKSEVSFPHP